MGKALLLVNMGGPASVDEIEEYLRAIFDDPAILPVPGLFRKMLASFIISRRINNVIQKYQKIGGASPLPEWTNRLSTLIAEKAKDRYPDVVVSYAFRYTSPTIEQSLVKLAGSGIKTAKLLPLFPHRTEAMTGSVEKEAIRVAQKLELNLELAPPWGNDNSIISIWRSYLNEHLDSPDEKAHVIFVAHGIPLKNVRNGDDYPEQVGLTAKTLGDALADKATWSLAYQSKVGPLKWTRPYIEEEIARVAPKCHNLILMPLSFVADCLETLYDLDQVAKEQANQAGISSIIRVRVFNDDPRFAEALMDIALGGADA